MPPPVNARIPLSLLEAIRRIDTPEGEPDTEYVQELRNKRLGLSDTVCLQIRRYADAVKRGQKIPHAEVSGLGTLIGRRPDAGELFVSAGGILAQEVYKSISPTRRKIIGVIPGPAARILAVRQLKAIAGRFFGGTVKRTGSSLTLRIPDSVTVHSPAKSVGCVFYESALRELMRLLVNAAGLVEHPLCSARGDAICEWHAEWRTPAPTPTPTPG